MCNRLIPFITSFRLAKKLNICYYLNWDDDCRDTDYVYEGNKTTYNDMFEYIDDVNYIDEKKMYELLNNNSYIFTVNYCNMKLHEYDISNLLKYDVIYFNNYVHPIFTYEDNILITCYSDIDWIINKTPYLVDIQKYFQLLKPVSRLQNKINDVLIKFPKNKNDIIGFHIRHWPDLWYKKNYNNYLLGNYEKRFQLMDEYIKNNINIKFYICSSDLNIINELIKKYGNRIIFFEDRLGNTYDDKYYSSNNICKCNKYKNLNGVIDLFLLSKCNLIIGDVASSYSISSTLLNIDSIYKQIKHIKSY